MRNYVSPVIFAGMNSRLQRKVRRISFITDKYPRLVFECVSEVFDISYEELIGRHRKQEKAYARHVFCYILKNNTKYSLKEIGEYLGGRDHATVLSSIKVAKNLAETDKVFRESINTAEALFKLKKNGTHSQKT